MKKLDVEFRVFLCSNKQKLSTFTLEILSDGVASP